MHDAGSAEPGATGEAGELRDTLPEDLDATAYVGTYRFPDNLRRRWIGILHGLFALAALAAWIASGHSAWLWAAALFVGVAVFHMLAAWPLRIDEADALVAATRAVGFAVGHASAQLTWRGFRSRPTWRILLYSADDPPSRRGFVELDAVDGHVLGQITEENPEDWTELTG